MTDAQQVPTESEEIPCCVVTVGGKDQGFPKCDEPAVGKATEPPYWPLCEEHFTFALIAGWKPQYFDDLDHPQPGDPDSMTVPCPTCGRPLTFGDSDDMTAICECGKSVFLDAYDCHYTVETSDCSHDFQSLYLGKSDYGNEASL